MQWLKIIILKMISFFRGEKTDPLPDQSEPSSKEPESLTRENWRKLIQEALHAHSLDSRSQRYGVEVVFYLHENNSDKRFFEDTFGSKSSPFTENKLFQVLKDQVLADKYASIPIHFNVQAHGDNQGNGIKNVEVREFDYSTFSNDNYELQVYAQTLAPENLIETLALPDKNKFIVGRDSPDRPDVIVGSRLTSFERYPTRQERYKEESLLTILSGCAFSLEVRGEDRWFCQARKQGEFMVVVNDENNRYEKPLDHPERKARYHLGDHIRVFDDFATKQDQLFFKVVKCNTIKTTKDGDQ